MLVISREGPLHGRRAETAARPAEAMAAVPEPLGNLVHVETLDLWNCEALSAVPESVGSLVQVETLDLWNCEALETVLGRENDRSLAEYVNRPNHQGETPLHNACKKQSSRSAQILLRAGATPARNSRQETPLHIACRSGSPQCLQLLLDHMLKFEDLAEACNTPLHLASMSSLDCAMKSG